MTLPRLRVRSLWVDEAFTMGAVRDLRRTMRATGGTMALYYVLIAPIAAVTHDRFWLRLPSALAVAATVWVTYAVGRRLRGVRLGGLAAGFVALSWFAARYGMEIRGYGLSLLLSSVSWLGLVAAVGAPPGRDRRRWWALFVVASLLAPLAHGISGLQLVVQVASLLLAPDRRLWLRRIVPVALAAAVEIGLLFSIGAGEVGSWVKPLNANQLLGFARVLIGDGLVARTVVAIALVGGVVVTIASLRRQRDLARWQSAVPLFWAAGLPVLLVAISLVRPYGVNRYLLSSLPGVALLAATALDRIPRRVPMALAGVALALCLWSDRRMAVTSTNERWSELADHLTVVIQPGDSVVMPPEARPAFDVAWDESERPTDPVPLRPAGEVGDVRRFYDEGPWSSSLEAIVRGGAPRIWYIDRGRGRGEEVEALITDPAVEARYRVTADQRFGRELILIGLEARDGQP